MGSNDKTPEYSPYMSGKMLASTKNHPTLAKASALERLGGRRAISLYRKSTRRRIGYIDTSVDVVTQVRMAVLGIGGDIERDIRIVHDSLKTCIPVVMESIACPGQSKGQQGRGTEASLAKVLIE